MSDELVFYTNPMSRGRIVRWMLEEVGQPYRTEILDYATHDEGAGLSGDQSDGQGAGDPHGDTVVTEGAAICAYLADAFPAGRPRAAAGDRRRGPYYRWLFFAAGPLEAASTNQALGFVVPPEREPDGRLWQLRGSARGAGERGVAGAIIWPATASPRPMSMSARRSASACSSARSRSARPSSSTWTPHPRPAAIRAREIDDALTPATPPAA